MVEGQVGAERLVEPVMEGPHSLLAQVVALVADQVGPLERPPGCVGIVESVDLWLAGAAQAQQPVDQPLALRRLLRRQETPRLLHRGALPERGQGRAPAKG